MVTGPCTTGPGGFWGILRTFCCGGWWMNWLPGMLHTKKEELVEKVKVKGSLGCNDHETWQIPTWGRLGGIRGPGEQVSLQGQPPEGIRVVYCTKWKLKQEYHLFTCVTLVTLVLGYTCGGWRADSWPSWDARREHTEGESRDGSPGGIQRHFLRTQRKNCKIQSSSWVEISKWCKGYRGASCAYMPGKSGQCQPGSSDHTASLLWWGRFKAKPGNQASRSGSGR